MKRLVFIFALAAAALAAQTTVPITKVPAGTKIGVTLTKPVWMNTAQTGDGIYGETNFPVMTDSSQIAIPPGTLVQGTLDIVTLPTKSSRAEIRLSLQKIVFLNGHATNLADSAQAAFTVLVSPRSDILLDNGTQVEFTLRQDLAISVPLPPVTPMLVRTYQSATRCVPTPAVPEVPGTVISGTSATPDTIIPGAPKTPDIVIPGAPGQPDTVIPGSPGTPDIVIPGTPGTPDQVVGGSPGSPEIPCPAPPSVLNVPPQYKEQLKLGRTSQIGSLPLKKGKYTVSWTGLGPATGVQILGHNKLIHTVPVHIEGTKNKASATQFGFLSAPGVPLQVTTVQFKDKGFLLRFDSPKEAI